MVPPEQANWEANDDQVYWVYAALTAMEYKFPSLTCVAPSSNCVNSWENVATNAFQDFVSRWQSDSQTCNGGLKWQYRSQVAGYNYKNTVSNGGFFQTAARLARYTGNSTYADWATKIWDWTMGTGLMSSDYHIYDGAGDQDGANCTTVNRLEWTYNMGAYLHGAAHMYAYNQTNGQPGGPDWEARVHGLLQTAQSTFFGPASNATGIMYERNCELTATCSVDQTSFKASLAQWMSKTAVLVPSVADDVNALLASTAQGAAASCSGLGNNTCGSKWYTNEWDGQVAFGVQLSALEAVQSLLVGNAPPLATSH
jgi:mannan endo-1,6-alpha-mannosidase